MRAVVECADKKIIIELNQGVLTKGNSINKKPDNAKKFLIPFLRGVGSVINIDRKGSIRYA